MKKIISVIFGLALAITAGAHDAKVASFRLVQKDNFFDIYAEFPWTLRNALLDFEPALIENHDPESWEKALKTYFTQNLQLWNQEGIELELLFVTELENDGHDHAAKYLLTFEGGEPIKIINTIMFDQSEHQVNKHTYYKERIYNFETTPGDAAYNFEGIKEKDNEWLWLLFFIIVAVTSFIFMKMRHKIYLKQKEYDALKGF